MLLRYEVCEYLRFQGPAGLAAPGPFRLWHKQPRHADTSTGTSRPLAGRRGESSAGDGRAKDAGEIAHAASTEAAVNKMVARGGICSRCGDAHSPSQCQFAHSQCFTCGKTGHLARVCRTAKPNSGPQQQPGSSPGQGRRRGRGRRQGRRRGQGRRQGRRRGPALGQGRRRKWRRGRAAAGSGFSAARLNVVSEDPPIFDMWHTGLVPSSVPPYVLTIEVCGRPISMELDTGASVSVMAGKLFKRTFPGVAIEASGIMLRSYSGELSQVQGQAQVSIRFGNREATLPLYLTKGSSPTLLGRNWICALGVRLPEGQEAALHVVQDIPSLLTNFQSLFSQGWAHSPVRLLASMYPRESGLCFSSLARCRSH